MYQQGARYRHERKVRPRLCAVSLFEKFGQRGNPAFKIEWGEYQAEDNQTE
jgi:hypothetical protein